MTAVARHVETAVRVLPESPDHLGLSKGWCVALCDEEEPLITIYRTALKGDAEQIAASIQDWLQEWLERVK